MNAVVPFTSHWDHPASSNRSIKEPTCVEPPYRRSISASVTIRWRIHLRVLVGFTTPPMCKPVGAVEPSKQGRATGFFFVVSSGLTGRTNRSTGPLLLRTIGHVPAGLIGVSKGEK